MDTPLHHRTEYSLETNEQSKKWIVTSEQAKKVKSAGKFVAFRMHVVLSSLAT